MTRIITRLALGVFLAAAALPAQTTASTNGVVSPHSSSLATTPSSVQQPSRGTLIPAFPAPFSRVAVGGGISLTGINLQAAINANKYLNIRGTGGFFNYTVNNVASHGFNVGAGLNLAAAGVSLDYFPFPRHGLRISPGMLLYNQDEVSGTLTAAGGTSFTLNNVTYYSSQAEPVTGVASLNLHQMSPAPTIAFGWGNLISRNGGHWSFPVEVGAAYIGQPQVAMSFVSGQVCDDPQGTIGCVDVVGNSSVNSNLQAQVAKDQKDVNPYTFFPIFSFGVGYSFGVR